MTPATSGWVQPGFDWNRIPGTTSIHLPWELLKANVLNVDRYSGIEEMLYSDEAFAGGLSQQGADGNFGMILHEHDKYNGTHRARKSFHFLDGMIVCLGSDIENANAEYPTETTVFQLAVTDKQGREFWKDAPAGNRKLWTDHLGTGYYVPVAARFEKNFPQLSRMQNTGAETKGDWVSLVIDHGKAPKAAGYEYAVFPQADAQRMSALLKRIPYKVLRKDRGAHIVQFGGDRVTSYVLFDTPQADLPGALLQRADTSCLVMTRQESAKQWLLTVAQPDLALYRGASDEAFDADGKRIERSIYSRPWINNESGEIAVTVTLRGRWKVEETPYCRIVSADKRQTQLRFLCREGRSFEVRLTK
ncbi:chondroitinase [Bacteroides pyogenes JCM 10003]|nr:chondroitinase [Bacteroides pyogenes JCM 10003]